MPITELGACEWFVWDLRRSNLIERGQLDQLCAEFLKQQPGAEPPALADFLVGEGTLTRFQADRVLQGKTEGLVLGPYTLMDALGTGSMGTVYKARSKLTNQWYAVKALPRRSMWNVRLARRQVRAFEQIKHPAIVPFVDVGTAGNTHYLAWPFVEGESLGSVVAAQTKLAPGVAARYACQAAEALDASHHAGLIHGMIKPSNLMIGNDGHLRILDFGIGSLLAESDAESLVDTMSTANSLTSGLDCAAPECIMEPTKRGPAGDQYSLGCVLYYCLTGRYPFPEGSAVEKMMAHQMKEPTPISRLQPDVPAGLVAVVERLMQKKPEARYSTVAAALDALMPFAEAFSNSRVEAKPDPAALKPARLPRLTPPVRVPAPPPPAPAPQIVPAPAPMPAVPTLAAMRLPGASATATERFGALGLLCGAMLVAILTCLVWAALHH